jgi:hypothetical protein
MSAIVSYGNFSRSPTKDEIERKMILNLLAEEEIAQLQQGAQNEDRFRELPAIMSPKDMTATSVPARK